MAISFGFEIEKKGATPGQMKQVHGKTLIEYESGSLEREADGIYTSKTNEEVFVFTADCLPVLFGSSTHVGAVHAGWRGTKKGIIEGMLSQFQRDSSLMVYWARVYETAVLK